MAGGGRSLTMEGSSGSVAKDVPILIGHLRDMSESLGKTRDHVGSLHQHLKTSASLSKSEIDLIGSKNQLLLRYDDIQKYQQCILTKVMQFL